MKVVALTAALILVIVWIGCANHRDWVWIHATLKQETMRTQALIDAQEDRLLAARELEQRLDGLLERIESATTQYEVDCSAYTFSVDECDEDPWMSSFGPSRLDQIAVSRDLENLFKPGDVVLIHLENGERLVRKVNDRLNRRYENRIDLALRSKIEARRFGVQNVRIQNISRVVNDEDNVSTGSSETGGECGGQ